MSLAHYINTGTRKSNEDYVRVDPSNKIFVIGDGMSKHVRGDMASLLGVETAFAYLHLNSVQVLGRVAEQIPFNLIPYFFLWNAGHFANRAVFDFNVANKIDSGSTLEAIRIIGNRLHLCHIGDSRVYRTRNGKLEQVTKDHYADTIIDGCLYSGITCSLGEVITRGDVLSCTLEKDEIVLICTDGLPNDVEDSTLENYVLKGKTPEEIKRIIAENHGGKTSDNCTFIIYKHDGLDINDGTHSPDWDRLRNALAKEKPRPITEPVIKENVIPKNKSLVERIKEMIRI